MKAADQGHADAQYNLAVLFDRGDGVLENKKLAMELYTKAAYQGKTAPSPPEDDALPSTTGTLTPSKLQNGGRVWGSSV
jgi:TPR repeat protein